jgi:hypothetical protein
MKQQTITGQFISGLPSPNQFGCLLSSPKSYIVKMTPKSFHYQSSAMTILDEKCNIPVSCIQPMPMNRISNVMIRVITSVVGSIHS